MSELNRNAGQAAFRFARTKACASSLSLSSSWNMNACMSVKRTVSSLTLQENRRHRQRGGRGRRRMGRARTYSRSEKAGSGVCTRDQVWSLRRPCLFRYMLSFRPDPYHTPKFYSFQGILAVSIPAMSPSYALHQSRGPMLVRKGRIEGMNGTVAVVQVPSWFCIYLALMNP